MAGTKSPFDNSPVEGPRGVFRFHEAPNAVDAGDISKDWQRNGGGKDPAGPTRSNYQTGSKRDLPDNDILSIAEAWATQGRAVALATVIETWGSAPRPTGSHLAIDSDGNFEGSVSGGCVEGAVVTEALDVIEVGRPRVLEFGVADETAWRVGLSCGGRIRVYVEKVA